MTLPLDNCLPLWPSSPLANSRAKIWAIGGGKGGVGKSLTTSNLSICLALMGHRVVAVDLDLGGANLHTMLGVPIPEATLSDCLTKKLHSMEKLITQTPIRNLSLVSGAHDNIEIANLKQIHKAKILAKIREIDADFVLMDLGAGTAFNTLDFFISADQGILVALPEPTSIENTYRFIKSVYHRKLKMTEEFLEVGPLIDKVINERTSSNAVPADLIQRVTKMNPEMGHRLQTEVSRLSPRLIVNQARTQADINIGFSMKIICKKYFGMKLDYAGYLEYDATVWQSVKKRRPLLMEFPNSALVQNFDRVVHKLLELHSG